jgi:hypothetical protein
MLAERREARGGHRKQLVDSVSSTRALAASLLTTLLMVELFSSKDAFSLKTNDGENGPSTADVRAIRNRLLTQATATRVLCDSGRTREAARLAAAGWSRRAGKETTSALLLLRMTYSDI